MLQLLRNGRSTIGGTLQRNNCHPSYHATAFPRACCSLLTSSFCCHGRLVQVVAAAHELHGRLKSTTHLPDMPSGFARC